MRESPQGHRLCLLEVFSLLAGEEPGDLPFLVVNVAHWLLGERYPREKQTVMAKRSQVTEMECNRLGLLCWHG